ncbi:hypothetical protein [Nocardioides sp.]|uniref:hypothetical protein n=1 Tax=Nocardioides sp. TaxID=35761 RepID=UPI00286B640E|nr:hypothetical protein [Nocardioides sp.]
MDRPTFSHPLDITNPLFPVGDLQSVIQVGTVEGKLFRSETTRLPQTGVVDWYGTRVPVVLSQYVAYLDGRIEEVAVDRYAQADDGSVWYFGEDVIDYQHGGAYFTEGTWLAGRDGPPAMLMPAHPELGDVFRVENVLGVVFEELSVVEVDKTVKGPTGPVTGAIVVDELGVDGTHSRKTLAPGYGEFLTKNRTELEAMAVATPTNAVPGGAPPALRHIYTAAWGTWEFARGDSWNSAKLSVDQIATAVSDLAEGNQPFRPMRLLQRSLTKLHAAVGGRDVRVTEEAAARVAQSAVDLEAQYLTSQEVERFRFHLHTMVLRQAAAAHRPADVNGEVAVLELLRARLELPADQATVMDRELTALRTAVDARNLLSAADVTARLGFLALDQG